MKFFIFKILQYYKAYLFKNKTTMGKGTNIGVQARVFNNIKSSIQIGENCSIHCDIICSNNGKINIGDYCSIRYKTTIESEQSVSIGNYVIISNNVIISDNNSHPTSYKKRRLMLESGEYGDLWGWKHSSSSAVVIHDDVWIGRNVHILKGVTIGKGSIIASGTVVAKNIPPFSLAYGNPCLIKKDKYNETN
nr:acyltransferase [uncultured Sulfurimonas sp.]